MPYNFTGSQAIAHEPTPAEIRQACAEIRARWSDLEHYEGSHCTLSVRGLPVLTQTGAAEPYELPLASARELGV